MKINQALPDSNPFSWENFSEKIPPQEGTEKKLIAVTGYARSGKGSLCNALENNIKKLYPNLSVQQFAFAESLRMEISDFLLENFQISAWTSDSKKKEIIRPMLVGYGMSKRKSSNNQYWIKKMENQIKQSPADICIINDLRFAENEFDELAWLGKNKNLHFHIRRYSKKGRKKIYQEAPNEYEKENEERLLSAALNVFEIPFYENEDDFYKKINEISLGILDKNIIFFL